MEKILEKEVKSEKYTYEISIVRDFPLELNIKCNEKNCSLPVNLPEEASMKLIFSEPLSTEKIRKMAEELNAVLEKKKKRIEHENSDELAQLTADILKSFINQGLIDRIVDRN